MGEGLSVPLPPYLSPPYFSMLSGSLSTQPPAPLAGPVGKLGSWARHCSGLGGKSRESPESWREGILK
ncbi:hypothetical protein CesoFtcFv8_017252 [Champsocephalus esox]|uniref:Uncharacterized protein n=2 Tax=Champsocephalus TaxID=52236 RepID=A0AAN8HIM9_CHAGU|nr:hypothetical protein CesoFtcFv8_017252 [Champsocephalus esox]KAK5916688.1 hypothetical protein CgunFtcFv8_011645 [Champsocephalus gunnari]